MATDKEPYFRRLATCGELMQEAGLEALLLTKPSNMLYLTGDGRLCAYAMITQGGKVALGVPSTDVEDVKRLAHFDHLVGFEDEVGMIHSIAHHILKDAGHGDHVFGPPIHGVGIEFEEAPLPAGHAFFHGEEAPPPLAANVVISVGNCGLYTGPWGVRVEDTNIVLPEGHETLTSYPRVLEARG